MEAFSTGTPEETTPVHLRCQCCSESVEAPTREQAEYLAWQRCWTVFRLGGGFSLYACPYHAGEVVTELPPLHGRLTIWTR
jgi:hypothetical protein